MIKLLRFHNYVIETLMVDNLDPARHWADGWVWQGMCMCFPHFDNAIYTVKNLIEHAFYGLTILELCFVNESDPSDTRSINYGDLFNQHSPLLVLRGCNHTWLDLGMRFTYCKHCNATGHHDRMRDTITILEN